MKASYVRGRKTPWSEQVVFLSPYDPPPFLNAAKGDTPLETPAGFLGAEAPKRREEVGRGLRRTASVASRRGGETASNSVSAPLLKERS